MQAFELKSLFSEDSRNKYPPEHPQRPGAKGRPHTLWTRCIVPLHPAGTFGGYFAGRMCPNPGMLRPSLCQGTFRRKSTGRQYSCPQHPQSPKIPASAGDRYTGGNRGQKGDHIPLERGREGRPYSEDDVRRVCQNDEERLPESRDRIVERREPPRHSFVLRIKRITNQYPRNPYSIRELLHC